ncbi:SRS domain-containing protein [Neospora caninum Liverpool]|uniref:SRS domain-containing protein n=1 Tax=Neospora caninum (strain Liverpool) TaxID=572307 RepID=F0VL97_NEOCL|nr:SRS domain-containing protein [Neospora caninum Liverpool]CBZ54849.1 SRS domain-containing protein [Neospora caninum Liverpool]CEL69568.1 TPA: SRS domain-containing protein [Neospora caninum Liverpool]|eukprot:XP_003884877.1 SRS domain-containing protein [Neospora caninum Liverpool]
MGRFCHFKRFSRCVLAILLASVLLDPISSSATHQDTSSTNTNQLETCDVTVPQQGKLKAHLDLTLKSDADSISFMCSSTQEATLLPSKEKAFKDDECSTQELLNTIFSGAELKETEHNGKSKYELIIPINSRTETKTLCYKCTVTAADPEISSRVAQPQAGKECKVKITVDKVEQTTPEPEENAEQLTGPIECDSTATTKEASVSAESPLSFKCGAGMSLHPTNLTDVFDDQDGKCAAEVALQTLVDATLTKTETEATQNGQPVYQLAVKTAPSEDTAICYKCVTTSSNLETKTNTDEASAARECLLKISVKGSATSAILSAWGVAQAAAAFCVAAQMLLGVVDL